MSVTPRFISKTLFLFIDYRSLIFIRIKFMSQTLKFDFYSTPVNMVQKTRAERNIAKEHILKKGRIKVEKNKAELLTFLSKIATASKI